MSTIQSLYSWATGIPGVGIQDELAVFIRQQSQAGHVYDLPENFLAAFEAFTGSAVPGVVHSPAPTPLGLPNLVSVNVKDYGVFGNGTTDDSANIQRAINACVAFGGAEVYFPIGTYLVAAGLVVPASYIRIRGAGAGLSVIKVAPNTTLPFTGVIGCFDPWNQVGNNISDLTVDCNGQNGVTNTANPNSVTQGIINIGSRSTSQRVELVNRNGIVGTTGLLAQGHDISVIDCEVHDDVWTQDRITVGGGIAGAKTFTPANGTTGWGVGQNVLLDPSVLGWSDSVVPAGSTVLVTPRCQKENAFPNGGWTSGMLGIVPGQSLVLGGAVSGISAVVNTAFTSQPIVQVTAAPAGGRTARFQAFLANSGLTLIFVAMDKGAGYATPPTITLSGGGGTLTSGPTAVLDSVAESITVGSVTKATFTASTVAGSHPAGAPLYYNGTPESAVISSVSGGNIGVTTQLTHSNGVAILTQPPLYDGIAMDGIALMTGQKRSKTFKVIGCRCYRLALDGIGVSECDDVLYQSNSVERCFSGATATNVNTLTLDDNVFDISTYGVMPWAAQYSSFFGLNIGVSQNAGGTSIVSWSASTHTGNTFRGGSANVYLFGPAGTIGGTIQRATQFSGCIFDGAQGHAVVATNVAGLSITGGVLRNSNAANQATSPVLGGGQGTCAAILLLGTVGSQTVDTVQVTGVEVIDDRAVHLMPAAVLSWGAFVTNVTFDHNPCKGLTGSPNTWVQWGSSAPPIVFRDNPGINPLVGAVTTAPTASPANNTHYQNLTGCDLMVALTGGTVTNVTLYDRNNANGVTVAAASPCVFTLPAGCWYSTLNSVAPVAAFAGM